MTRATRASLLLWTACSGASAPALDAGRDSSTTDAAFDCAASLLRLDALRQAATACASNATCDAQVLDLCCPLHVTSSSANGAQAFRLELDAYRRAGCPNSLCSAKPCSVASACVDGHCTQP